MLNKFLALLLLLVTQNVFASNVPWLNQSANTFLAAPSGSSGNMTSRAIVGADLPFPTVSTLGGVESLTCSTNQFYTSISTSGIPACTQPTFANISGTITTSTQLPTSGVTAASYTNANITVTAQGIITAASSGSAGYSPSVKAKSSAYTAVSGDIILATATASFVVTIPLAASNTNGIIQVKKIDASANTVTLTASGSDKIDGLASQVLGVQYDSVNLVSDGSANWYVF